MQSRTTKGSSQCSGSGTKSFHNNRNIVEQRTHTHTAIEMGKAGKAIPKESKEEKSPLLLLML